MSHDAAGRRRRPGRVMGLVATSVVVFACGPGVAPGRSVPRTYVGAAVGGTLLTTARAQTFDTSYSVGDEQRLMLGTYASGSSHGPRMRIQPNAASHSATRAQLAAGFVVARWINRDSIAYRKLGSVGGDTTYWFVDSIPAGWRSRYISTSYPDSMVVDDSLVIHPRSPAHLQSLARWVWLDDDETGWVTCTTTGCCTSRAAVRSMTGSGG